MRALSTVCLGLSLAIAAPGPLSHLPATAFEAHAGPGEQSSAAAAGEEENSPQAADRESGESVVIDGEALESALGREVRTRSEENMGRIVDLLCNRKGEVLAAVIEFGGFLGIGTRKVAVRWSALSIDASSKSPVFVLDLTRDQIQTMPEYKPRAPAVTSKPSN